MVESEKEGREMVFSTLANDEKQRTDMELSQFSEEEIMEIEPLEVQRGEVSRGEGLNTHFSIPEGEEEKIGCSHVWSRFLPLWAFLI